MSSSDTLVWHRIESKGFEPSCREGHTSVHSNDSNQKLYIFGGFETEKRVNTTLSFNLASSSWDLIEAKGDVPCARAYHAACMVEKYMIIHGGDGVQLSSTQAIDRTVDDGSKKLNFFETVDVCPGDGLGYLMNGAIVLKPGSDDGPIRCLDDMFAFDTSTGLWSKVHCALAPLPRKGHTLNILNLDIDRRNEPYLFMFGGYDSDSDKLTNSIHICAVRELVNHLKHQKDDDSSPRSRIYKKNSFFVPWRLLKTTGSAPSPRFFHSTTFIPGGNMSNDKIFVFGGIVKKTKTSEGLGPTNDLHILDLHNLTWVNVKTTNASPSRSLPHEQVPLINEGKLKPPPVFRHSAFPIHSHHSTSLSAEGSPSPSLVIFGGAVDMRNSTASFLRSIFSFDITSNEWSKVQTGFIFPVERKGQTATLVPNWSPGNALPILEDLGVTIASPSLDLDITNPEMTQSPPANVPKKSSDKKYVPGVSGTSRTGVVRQLQISSSKKGVTAITMSDTDILPRQMHQPSSVIIFGGSNTLLKHRDLWVLDLQWRSFGINQFDHSAIPSQLNEDHAEEELVIERARKTHAAQLRTLVEKAYGIQNTNQEDDNEDVSPFNEETLTLTRKSHRESYQGEDYDFFPPFEREITDAKFTAQLLNETEDVRDFLANSLGQYLPSEKEEIGKAFLKARKEKAIADMQMLTAIEQAKAAEAKVEALEETIAALKRHISSIADSHAKEAALLEKELAETKEKERTLKALNEEAYRLLAARISEDL